MDGLVASTTSNVSECREFLERAPEMHLLLLGLLENKNAGVLTKVNRGDVVVAVSLLTSFALVLSESTESVVDLAKVFAPVAAKVFVFFILFFWF
jgi:hypothetical protein